MIVFKGIIGLFLLINLVMFFICCCCHFNISTTLHVTTTLYYRFFYKLKIILGNAFKHPLISLDFLLKKFISFIIYIFSLLAYPGHILGTYPILIKLFICYSIFNLFDFSILMKLILTTICFIFSTIILSKKEKIIYDKVFPKVTTFWAGLCKWHKTYENERLARYEKQLGIYKSPKTDPGEFAKQKVKNYYESLNELEQKHNRVPKKKHPHKINYMDVLYPNELFIFDFYKKDFTLEDLKKKKKELLKANHTDNFLTPEKIYNANETCKKITEAYTILFKELSKQKEA